MKRTAWISWHTVVLAGSSEHIAGEGKTAVAPFSDLWPMIAVIRHELIPQTLSMRVFSDHDAAQYVALCMAVRPY